MSLIDALAIVSCLVAAGIFAATFSVVGAVAILAPFFSFGLALERDWRDAARWMAWWLVSLVALVLLIWIDGNVEPWWPR